LGGGTPSVIFFLTTTGNMRFLSALTRYVVAAVAAVVASAVLQGDADNDGLADDTEAFLATRFMPRYHFHENERFYPMQVEPYLQRAKLFYRRHTYAPSCLFTLGSGYHSVSMPVLTVSPDQYEVCMDMASTVQPRLRGSASGVADDEAYECDLNALQCDLFNNTRHNVMQCVSMSTRMDQTFYMHIGAAWASPFNMSAPVYTHVHPLPPTSEFGPGHVVVQYWLFYAFNGPMDDMLMAGAHEGDWEHVSVVVSPTFEHIAAVYMAAHSHEARWLRPGSFSVQERTHVDVFVALQSHASYQTPGHKQRISDNVLYSFLYDDCSNSGYMWQPSLIVNMGEKDYPLVLWAYYNGFWGSQQTVYSFVPLPFDTASPPKGPMHQLDYWFVN
jgi:hypothetical protein